jgi:hypothetical protein
LPRPSGAAAKTGQGHFADSGRIYFSPDELEYFLLTGVTRLYIYLHIQLSIIK